MNATAAVFPALALHWTQAPGTCIPLVETVVCAMASRPTYWVPAPPLPLLPDLPEAHPAIRFTSLKLLLWAISTSAASFIALKVSCTAWSHQDTPKILRFIHASGMRVGPVGLTIPWHCHSIYTSNKRKQIKIKLRVCPKDNTNYQPTKKKKKIKNKQQLLYKINKNKRQMKKKLSVASIASLHLNCTYTN